MKSFICLFSILFTQFVFCDDMLIDKENNKKLIVFIGLGCPDELVDEEKFNQLNFSDEKREENLQKGIDICKKNDLDISCELLAQYYFYELDFSKSLYWSMKGAEKGSSRCMSILRYLYANGSGILQDYSESLKWMYLSAAKGDKDEAKTLQSLINDSNQSESLSAVLKEGKKRAKIWQDQHLEAFFVPN